MNYWLTAAATVSAVTFLIHVLLGGKELHVPLLKSAMHPIAKSIWTVVWHVVSTVIALNAIAFYLAARPGANAMMISAYPLAVSIGFIVLFLGYGILRLGSIVQMPQWTLFLMSSVLATIGLLPASV